MQSIVLLYMAMGENDVSKVKIGNFTDYLYVGVSIFHIYYMCIVKLHIAMLYSKKSNRGIFTDISVVS